jgi:hypothetical protein
MIRAINADPKHRFSPRAIADLGVPVDRFLYRYGRDYRAFAAGLERFGMWPPLLIVTSEAFTARELATQDWVPGLRRIARHYPRLTAVQLGNEADQPRSTSSWYLPGPTLSALYRAAREVWPVGCGVTLVGAGLVSGNPAYLEDVDLAPLDAIAVHPYGKYPHHEEPEYDLGTLIRAYQAQAPGYPIWLTELGAEHTWFKGAKAEHARAVWHSEMLVALDELGVALAAVFCYSDKMHPGFGLVKGDGAPYESFAALADAA